MFIRWEASSFSWNFCFIRNLNDRETSDLIVLMSLLDYVTFSLVLDRHISSLDSPRSYSWKSFDFLVKNTSNQVMPFTISFWKIKVPSKVKVFVWAAVLIGLILMICFKCIGLIRLYLQICVTVEIQKFRDQ